MLEAVTLNWNSFFQIMKKYFSHIYRGINWEAAAYDETGSMKTVWWWDSEREWQAVAGIVLKKRKGEERGEADSHMNRLYSSLLMTPAVPFLPKARITIKPKSHLLTWSPSLPKVYSHTCTDVSTQSGGGGARERLDEREVGWAVVTGQTEETWTRVAAIAK